MVFPTRAYDSSARGFVNSLLWSGHQIQSSLVSGHHLQCERGCAVLWEHNPEMERDSRMGGGDGLLEGVSGWGGVVVLDWTLRKAMYWGECQVSCRCSQYKAWAHGSLS